VVSSVPSHIAVFVTFVVNARKNVTSIFAAAGLLAAEIGLSIEVEVVTVAVRRVGGLFALERVFLLLTL
jgi:hypothetical protein